MLKRICFARAKRTAELLTRWSEFWTDVAEWFDGHATWAAIRRRRGGQS